MIAHYSHYFINRYTLLELKVKQFLKGHHTNDLQY